MPRPIQRDDDAPSHDSFLDIVANMVGILIILVMVAGMRIKNAPVVAAISSEARQAVEELQQDAATERSFQDDVMRTAQQLDEIQQETLIHRRQRDLMMTIASTVEHEIESRRRQMDDETRIKYDLTRELSQLKFQLSQLDQRRFQVETAPTEPTVVESYPTPLSETVNGRESHFQLRGGRIAPIPLDDLVSQLKEAAGRQKYKLADLPEVSGMVGPLDGFRLRYTLARFDISPEVAMATGRRGAYAQLTKWTLIPVSGQMGEPVEMALAEGSEFRQIISKLDPQRSTVTIWTYPDSFGSFRRLKKELFRQGFATAARPLPHDVPISGSPMGSRSAAQ